MKNYNAFKKWRAYAKSKSYPFYVVGSPIELLIARFNSQIKPIVFYSNSSMYMHSLIRTAIWSCVFFILYPMVMGLNVKYGLILTALTIVLVPIIDVLLLTRFKKKESFPDWKTFKT